MRILTLVIVLAALHLLTSCDKNNLPDGMTHQDLQSIGLGDDVVFKDEVRYLNPDQASAATISGDTLSFPTENSWTEETYEGQILWSPRGKTWNQNFAKRIISINRDQDHVRLVTKDVNLTSIFASISYQLDGTPGLDDCPIQSPAMIRSYNQDTMHLFPAYANGMWGFIDQDGSWVFGPKYYQAEKFSNGLAAVQQCKNGRWGYINTNGEVAIEAIFLKAEPFSEDYAPVTISEDLLGMISRDGEIIFKDSLNKLYGFSEGLASAETMNQQNGFIDINGKWVIPPSYRDAGTFSEGMSSVRKNRNSDWGYLNADENWAIEPQYKDAGPFSEGLAPVSVGVFEYTYINKRGEIMFDRRYENAYPYSDGLALVEYEDDWKYINTDGETVIDGYQDREFCRAYPFENGLALVYIENDDSGCRMGRKVENIFLWRNGTMAYINKDGETVYEYAQNLRF